MPSGRYVAIASVIALAGCEESGALKPGMWTTEVSMAAKAGELWSSKVERCIDPGGGDAVIGMLSGTPLGPCQATESGTSGGGLPLSAHCMGRPGSMMGSMPQTRVRLNGTQSATAIDGTIDAELVMEPQSPKLTGKLIARRTGDCPS